jgi:hypothetical protein
MDRRAEMEGRSLVVLSKLNSPKKHHGDYALVTSKIHYQKTTGDEHVDLGGYSLMDGDKLREQVRAPTSNFLPQAKHHVGMTTVWNSETGRETSREEIGILDGQTSFNACRELREVRGMVSRLRGEIDVGLTRLDTLIQKLESNGPGQALGLQKDGGPKGKEKWGWKA